MSEVQKAIEEITYRTNVFPEKAFQVITANKEEAVPYLREAVEYAACKGMELEEDYQLHFYALFLLGEFKDRDSFPQIMKLVSLPEDEVEYLIGDGKTEGLKDILYNTYNGDIDLLKSSIQNKNIDEFVRSSMLDVLGQLYLDGTMKENEWKDFLKEIVYSGGEYDYVYNTVELTLCQCHFVDMLPEIRYMFEQDLLDEIVMGKYDSCVDAMFRYRERDKRFCRESINAADTLRHWAMFTQKSEDSHISDVDYGKMLRELDRGWDSPAKKIKIGRNDPCPCGSGKKYKYCCLNKPKSAIDSIESLEERNKWLKNYPYTGRERIEGRVYLEDYFDLSGVEIDKILYLALKNRPGLIWKRDRKAEAERSKKYLYLAFQKCREKMEEEQIQSLAEYDEKFSIHYRCEEWLGELCRYLQESGDMERYEEVKGFISER